MNVWQRLWQQRPPNLKESLHTHDGGRRKLRHRRGPTTIRNNSKTHMRHWATALTTIRREAQKAAAAASSLSGLAAAAAVFEGFHPHITHKVYSFLLTASTLPLAVAATSSSVTTLQRSESTHWIVGTSVPPSQIISESTCGRSRRFSHLKKTEVRGRNTHRPQWWPAEDDVNCVEFERLHYFWIRTNSQNGQTKFQIEERFIRKTKSRDLL